MAHFKYYDKDFHNYFLYEDYSDDVVVKVPIGPNPDCFASHLDLTGVALRTQVLNNKTSTLFDFWEDENKPADGSLNYEYAINTHNPGQVPIVLITPRHAVTCAHYFCSGWNCDPCREIDILADGVPTVPCDPDDLRFDGCGGGGFDDSGAPTGGCHARPGPNGEVLRAPLQDGTAGANLSLSSTPAISVNQDWPEDARDFKTLVFMNKDGEKFTRNYQLLSLRIDDSMFPPNVQLGDDYLILELDEPIGEEEGIAVYNKFLGTQTDPAPYMSAMLYQLDPQSRIYARRTIDGRVMLANATQFTVNTPNDFPELGATEDVISNGGNVSGYGEVLIYGGDSGSPAFIHSEEHGTLLQWGWGTFRPGIFPDVGIDQLNTFLETFNADNGTDYVIEKISGNDLHKELRIPTPLDMDVLDPSPRESNATAVFCDAEVELDSTDIISARSNISFADIGGDEFAARFSSFTLGAGADTLPFLHPETSDGYTLYRVNDDDAIFVSSYRPVFSDVSPKEPDAPNLTFTGSLIIIPDEVTEQDVFTIAVSSAGLVSTEDPIGMPAWSVDLPGFDVPDLDYAPLSTTATMIAMLSNANGEMEHSETVNIATGKIPYDVSVSADTALEVENEITVTVEWPEDVIPTPKVLMEILIKDLEPGEFGIPLGFEHRLVSIDDWAPIGTNTFSHSFTLPCELSDDTDESNTLTSIIGKSLLVSFSVRNILGVVSSVNPDIFPAWNRFFDLGEIQDTDNTCGTTTFHDISVGDEGDSQFGFIPQTINDASVGDVLRFTWGNNGFHNVVSGECVEGTCTWDGTFPDDPFRSGDLQQGKGTIWEWTIPPEAAGSTIPYFCEAHGPSLGMVGFITIK